MMKVVLWGLISITSIAKIAIYFLQTFNKAILEVARSEISGDEMAKVGVSSTGPGKIIMKLKKRPSRLIVPDYSAPANLKLLEEEIIAVPNLEHSTVLLIIDEISGKDFFLASKKGARKDRLMEDTYSVTLDILGNPKKAFFSVIDGHGGRDAADFTANNLGKNLVKRLTENNEEEEEEAIHKAAYSVTDQEFLSQGLSGGACVASVFLKEGEVQAANVGDCRVVLCRNGVAEALTTDHRPIREDERLRIENSGGFVHRTINGVWRVQGSLAVSRAIGDRQLKEWVISEPEITKLPLTCDCQFLILASDGLWDKVTEQEAVDLVIREEENMQSSCKKLIETATKRGGVDDITVMVVPLQSFCQEMVSWK